MWKTSLLLFAAVIGCHSSMDDMSSMRGYIDEARHETSRHLEMARSATTMQHMRDEMDVHRSGMATMIADMDATMASMTGHCDGMGLDEMHVMHGDIEGELTQHLGIMDASTELATSQAEVERHAATMLSMMDGMDGPMGTMHCR
jgi:hypothetical protein